MKQAKIFTDIINSSVNFNDFELQNSVRKLSGQTNLAKDSALQFAKSIAYNWAYEKNDFTKATQENKDKEKIRKNQENDEGPIPEI